MDKNEAMIAYLRNYTDINDNALFFNYGSVEDNAHQVFVNSDDISLQKSYIDGSKLKRYTIHIDTFKSVTDIPLVANHSAENVDDLQEVQKLIDWVNEQSDARVFPNFGDDCIIDDMKVLMEKPDLLGVDDTVNPPMAIYRVSIQIDYIDISKRLWS